MDFTTLGYCPHVITETRKDAELYCHICAPKVITAFRAEVKRLRGEHPKVRQIFERLESRLALTEKVVVKAEKHNRLGRHAEWCFKQGLWCACGKEELDAALRDCPLLEEEE